MITIAHRKKLKKLFKSGYSEDIKEILSSKNILGKTGKPFSSSYINHVFNGRNTNEDIEDAIFELYQKRVYEVSKKKELRSQIL
jgi:hypothetical protein